MKMGEEKNGYLKSSIPADRNTGFVQLRHFSRIMGEEKMDGNY
jgi:hypothetical protein